MSQANLFNEAEIIPLSQSVHLSYFPDVFTDPADDWFRQLRNEINWQQADITIAGKRMPIPRLQAWHADAGRHYGYSGIRLEPQPWTPMLLDIKKQIETLVNHSFNSVLLNLFRNGNDSVGWHADDELELGRLPVIASVSLGESRTFLLRPKKRHVSTTNQQQQVSLPLANGSLLVMGAGTQEQWEHAVLKEKHSDGERINLTFRDIKL